MLLQNPDDLLVRKAAALHALVLVVGQSELQTGLSPWGKVKAFEDSNLESLHSQLRRHRTLFSALGFTVQH